MAVPQEARQTAPRMVILITKEEDKKKIIESTPLQRLGKGVDVANAVFFLSSNDASFITGQILGVDGGATTF